MRRSKETASHHSSLRRGRTAEKGLARLSGKLSGRQVEKYKKRFELHGIKIKEAVTGQKLILRRVTMRVMVIVKASPETEAGKMPSQKELADMSKFNEELVDAGIMLAAEGLHPSSRGERVIFSAGKKAVVQGPFGQPKELVAGFWIWRVKTVEEAVEWIKRAPFEEEEVEIRQVFEPEDFGEELTPELRAKEERLRAEVEHQRHP
jgi:hypothetical protein